MAIGVQEHYDKASCGGGCLTIYDMEHAESIQRRQNGEESRFIKFYTLRGSLRFARARAVIVRKRSAGFYNLDHMYPSNPSVGRLGTSKLAPQLLVEGKTVYVTSTPVLSEVHMW